jgi:hypothetical protein
MIYALRVVENRADQAVPHSPPFPHSPAFGSPTSPLAFGEIPSVRKGPERGLASLPPLPYSRVS